MDSFLLLPHSLGPIAVIPSPRRLTSCLAVIQMTSTLYTRPTTTAPDLLSVTTPFVQPSECGSYWYLTSGLFEDYASHSTISPIVSDPADKRFSSCQPSGWDSVASKNRFSFSPGVCPSKWVYNDMAEAVSTTDNSLATYSTAYCCARCALLDFST